MKLSKDAGYDANAYNNLNGNDITGYDNVPQNDYINDIVNNDDINGNNGGFGV